MTPRKSRLYIVDLASYTTDSPRAFWLKPIGKSPEELAAEIKAFLAAGSPGNEEYACHDYEKFPDLGEYPRVEDIAVAAEKVNFINRTERDGPAIVQAYLGHVGEASMLKHFGRVFCGLFESEVAYARSYAAEVLQIERMMGEYAIYFDHQAYAEDMFVNSHFSVKIGPKQYAVFQRI